MKWEYNGLGRWFALSSTNENNVRTPTWIIYVQPDGLFSVSQSDRELYPRTDPFESLRVAQVYCVEQDRERWERFVGEFN